jgi:hypothetical protein
MYVASGDAALLLSNIHHRFKRVSGDSARAGARPLNVAGTDTIDMTKLESHAWPYRSFCDLFTYGLALASLMLNHSMWAYNPVVIKDLEITFRQSCPKPPCDYPNERPNLKQTAKWVWQLDHP